MKMFIEFLRFFFVSLETIVLVLSLICLFYMDPSRFSFASDLMTNNEFVKYFSLLPVGVFIWMIVYLRKLLFPEKDSEEIMQSWPDYFKLKSCAIAALVWGSIFSIMAIIGWVMSINGIYKTAFVLLISSIIGSLIDAFSIYLAEISINERFCIGKDTNKTSQK